MKKRILKINFNIIKHTNTMGKMLILKELWLFLKNKKKWWLLPIIIFLLVMGIIIVAVEGSAIAPLIYAIF